MDDVLARGSLAVPAHLRSATWREQRDHGHGVGYVYPHDFIGADVEQQYLPDELADRTYYVPSDHGYEKTIGERMAVRQATRAEAADQGGPERDPTAMPKSNGMKVAGKVMAQREGKRRDLAAR